MSSQSKMISKRSAMKSRPSDGQAQEKHVTFLSPTPKRTNESERTSSPMHASLTLSSPQEEPAFVIPSQYEELCIDEDNEIAEIAEIAENDEATEDAEIAEEEEVTNDDQMEGSSGDHDEDDRVQGLLELPEIKDDIPMLLDWMNVTTINLEEALMMQDEEEEKYMEAIVNTLLLNEQHLILNEQRYELEYAHQEDVDEQLIHDAEAVEQEKARFNAMIDELDEIDLTEDEPADGEPILEKSTVQEPPAEKSFEMGSLEEQPAEKSFEMGPPAEQSQPEKEAPEDEMI